MNPVKEHLINLPAYRDRPSVEVAATQVMSAYRHLRPTTELYTAPNGAQMQLLNLRGTIPTTYRGATYHTPIVMWFEHTFPGTAPILFVVPDAGLRVARGTILNATGQVEITRWYNETRNLVTVLQRVQEVFNHEPPLFKDTTGPLRERLTHKCRETLQSYFAQTRDELDAAMEQQQTLSSRAEELQQAILALQDQRQAFAHHITAIQAKTRETQDWLEVNSSTKVDDDFERAVQPYDVISRQLVELVATVAACDDTIFYLNRGFASEVMPLDEYMKQVRKVARRQFEAKALALKIYQVQAKLAGRSIS